LDGYCGYIRGMTKSPNGLAALQNSAVAALRAYLQAEDSEDKTKALKQTATLFVKARAHFFTKEGEPDWMGRTYAYRQWVREVMETAGVDRADVTSLQSSLRYHSGSALREILPDETREDLGLVEQSPRERSREKRGRQLEAIQVFSGGGQEITDVEEILTAGNMMIVALRRVSLEGVNALTPDERKQIADIYRNVCSLSEKIEKAGKSK
jgi:hypothetical protein